VRLGIVTPVLTLLPRAHARWEVDAPFSEVVAIAREAERLGYHHLTCSEHVAIPVDVAEVRGARYYDPLATLGYLAAVTSSIRLATHVVVLGYHHPLAIAKRYGTLDRLSGGRLVLGVGVGSLEAEFALLGAPFPDRGERADDAMRALRAALGEREPRYDGSWYSFAELVVDPCATQPHVPMWVGGRTARSLRRAVELGDGWAPFGLATDEIGEMLAKAREGAAWRARGTAPFEVVVQNEHPFDPAGEPDRVAAQLRRFAGVGATAVNLRFVHHSAQHYREQLDAMARVAQDAGMSNSS
jgi:probable F420-dependent oxidoreductase